MIDFLTFKTFITPTVLIFFYYIGAILVPIFIYHRQKYILNKLSINKINLKISTKLILIAFFIILEIMWRMMFEVMIGYFQIHNALTHSVG